MRRRRRPRGSTSSRRSRRRLGAIIGYSTTVPSRWKLTQLLGKIASGFAGCSVSCATTTCTPARARPSANASNSAAPPRGRRPHPRPAARCSLEDVARGGLRIESETGRPHHQHGRCALRFLVGRGYGIKLNYIRVRAYPAPARERCGSGGGCPTRQRASEETREMNLPVALKKLVLATVLTAASRRPRPSSANTHAGQPSAEKAAPSAGV